ncbi:MAG TPA: DinB family protein [Gemmatimonadaceae bacterium]
MRCRFVGAGVLLWLTAVPVAAALAQNDVVMSFKFFALHYGGLLATAFDSIPAAKYEFRPTPAQQSIGFIAQHVEAANYGLCERLGTPRPKRSTMDAVPDTVKATWPKDTLVARLRASLAYCDSAISKLSDSQLNQPMSYGPPGSNLKAVPSRTLLGFVTDLAEHYSQLASYMRLIGLTPPSALPMKQHTPIDLPAAALSKYIGSYDLPASAFQGSPGVRLEVTVRDGALYIKPANQPEARLWSETAHDFFVKEADIQVTFTEDAAGRVTGLVVHQNGEDRRARKIG